MQPHWADTPFSEHRCPCCCPAANTPPDDRLPPGGGFVPFLMLRGNWLRQTGMLGGTKLMVEASEGLITIRPFGTPRPLDPNVRSCMEREVHFNEAQGHTHVVPAKEPYVLSRTVMVRVKVGEDLRRRFKAAAWRSGHTPAQVLRLLMEKYVEIEDDPRTADPAVWSKTFKLAATAVVRQLTPQPPICVNEDDDEVTVARKEGWASPGFARW